MTSLEEIIGEIKLHSMDGINKYTGMKWEFRNQYPY